ncbi:hypothetical protein [Algicola sagamiensis]|uniref:hypothetical protein n=1 Tax=Algicola sagamiensis TaxID=163869 RepID=UPI000362ECFE|nr:hypothetical protein [Algicola sagamiensis]
MPQGIGYSFSTNIQTPDLFSGSQPRQGLNTPEQTPNDQPPQQREPSIRQDPRGIEVLEQSRTVISDVPGRNASLAIEAYEGLATLSRREELESLVGVDVFV